MKTKVVKALVAVFLLTMLGGCRSSQSSVTAKQPRNWCDVYNRSGKRIATFTSQKAINYFSDFPKKAAGNVKKASLPVNSQINYRYVIHQKIKNEKATWRIYTNKYAVLNFHPHHDMSSPATFRTIWRLNNQTYAEVSHLQNFK